MKNCPVCGTELAEEAMFCFHCGKSFADPEPETAPSAEEVSQAEEAPAPEAAAPLPPVEEAPVFVSESTIPPKKLLLNTFQYMMLMLLFSIPVVGLIFLFVWGAGHPKNPSLKRFSAAVLLWRLILAALLVGGLLALLLFCGPQVQEALPRIIGEIHRIFGIVLY